MRAIAWDGNTAKTIIGEIDNALEWSMLCEESKTQVRTVKPIVFSTNLKQERLVMLRHGTSFVPFVVKGIGRQLLADLTDDDIEAEGFSDLTSFKEFWIMKNESKYFSPHERVYVTTLKRFRPDDLECLSAMQNLALQVYPLTVR